MEAAPVPLPPPEPPPAQVFLEATTKSDVIIATSVVPLEPAESFGEVAPGTAAARQSRKPRGTKLEVAQNKWQDSHLKLCKAKDALDIAYDQQKLHPANQKFVATLHRCSQDLDAAEQLERELHKRLQDERSKEPQRRGKRPRSAEEPDQLANESASAAHGAATAPAASSTKAKPMCDAAVVLLVSIKLKWEKKFCNNSDVNEAVWKHVADDYNEQAFKRGIDVENLPRRVEYVKNKYGTEFDHFKAEIRRQKTNSVSGAARDAVENLHARPTYKIFFDNDMHTRDLVWPAHNVNGSNYKEGGQYSEAANKKSRSKNLRHQSLDKNSHACSSASTSDACLDILENGEDSGDGGQEESEHGEEEETIDVDSVEVDELLKNTYASERRPLNIGGGSSYKYRPGRSDPTFLREQESTEQKTASATAMAIRDFVSVMAVQAEKDRAAMEKATEVMKQTADDARKFREQELQNQLLMKREELAHQARMASELAPNGCTQQ